MTKRQCVDEILKINRSAKPEFLAKFTQEELAEYIRHLGAVAVPRADLYRRLAPPPAPRRPRQAPVFQPATLTAPIPEPDDPTPADVDEPTPAERDQAVPGDSIDYDEAMPAEPVEPAPAPPAEDGEPDEPAMEELQPVGAGDTRGNSDGVQETFLF